jgi:hypothetical protein
MNFMIFNNHSPIIIRRMCANLNNLYTDNMEKRSSSYIIGRIQMCKNLKHNNTIHFIIITIYELEYLNYKTVIAPSNNARKFHIILVVMNLNVSS